MHLRALIFCLTAPVLLVALAEQYPHAVAEVAAFARIAMTYVT